MSIVYKYKLERLESQFLEIPVVADILSVQIQNGDICLWALVDLELGVENKEIIIVGTGMTINCNVNHIGTVQEDSFVWHVFERDE